MTTSRDSATSNQIDTSSGGIPTSHSPASGKAKDRKSVATHLYIPALAATQILSGLFAGFFVTYQISIIRAFAQVSDTTYVLAFQSINSTVRSAEFAIIFFGTVPMIGLALLLSLNRGTSADKWLGAALMLALATVAITFLGNIPLNNALGAVDASRPELSMLGRLAFEAPWNSLNLMRTLTALATAFCVTAGTLSLGDSCQK